MQQSSGEAYRYVRGDDDKDKNLSPLQFRYFSEVSTAY